MPCRQGFSVPCQVGFRVEPHVEQAALNPGGGPALPDRFECSWPAIGDDHGRGWEPGKKRLPCGYGFTVAPLSANDV